MFELSYKSHIPIIGVQTDDVVNVEAVLQTITGMKTQPFPKVKMGQLGPYLYWTQDIEVVTADNYKNLVKTEHQLVVINCHHNSLVFETGPLLTPKSMITAYLEDFAEAEKIPHLLEVLKGLSLKTASEIVQLTMASTGGILPQDVRRTRTRLSVGVRGLLPLDTEMDFYIMPPVLKQWIDLNTKFFLDDTTPYQLRPRGLMMAGERGVGKTMGARAIASAWNIPLYRLNIPTSLDKYIGVSEGRIEDSLLLLEREAPCVVLLDEVEKIFTGSDESGVTKRILSQLLWWLAEHRSKVITVMTTNDLKSLPSELYREGRLDKVLQLPMLTTAESKVFGVEVYKGVTGFTTVGMKVQNSIRSAVEDVNAQNMSHAEVSGLVYNLIKNHPWMLGK
jgi:hypothetical protein